MFIIAITGGALYMKGKTIMENDFEKLKELVNASSSRRKTRFDTYQEDLLKYLLSKLEGSNVSASTLMEIAQFATTQTQIVLGDELYRAQKEWKREIRISRHELLRRREDKDVAD